MNALKYVDFHCHLDLYANPSETIAAAEAARVYTLGVTTTPLAWSENLRLTRRSQFVRSALGLHPQLVSERHTELKLLETHLSETRYVGEVGLDAGPKFFRSLDLQKEVFQNILARCATMPGKVLSVHSVRAASAVLDSLEAYLPTDAAKVVLHWFTGSESEARRAVQLGCYFSVNGSMLRSENGLKILKGLPLNRILTETDGPFTEVQGRPARPDDVPLIVDDLAKVRSMEHSDMAAVILENLNEVLSDVSPSLAN